ncbi:hypothetical protein ACFPRL_36395 [Pseudoclavibacter helvolus]
MLFSEHICKGQQVILSPHEPHRTRSRQRRSRFSLRDAADLPRPHQERVHQASPLVRTDPS